jgi:hypothetical protein
VAAVIPPQSGLTIRLGIYAGSNATGSLPAELLGTWTHGSISALGFYSPTTGTFGPPSGEGTFYTFNADGSYEMGGLLQTSLGSCSTDAYTDMTGNATAAGGTLSLNPASGTTHWTHSCDSSADSTVPAVLAPHAYPYQLATENGQSVLYLDTGVSSTPERYLRQ